MLTGKLPIKVGRKKNQSAVAARHQPYPHLEAALAHVSDAVITVDIANLVTYMNPAAQELTGWRLREALRRSLDEVFSVVHAAADDQGCDAVGSLKRANASAGNPSRPIFIEHTKSPILDIDGASSGTVVVFRDVTRWRVAELALQSSRDSLVANADALFEEKERAQVTLNSIGDAVISTDFRGCVSFLNIVAEKMTGWTQAEAEGRQLDEIFFLVDATTREQIACPTMKAIIENRTVGIDATCILVRRDGTEVAIEDSASPIHDKHGGVIGAVMVAHDVTVARDFANKLARIALHDNLTALPNRTLFADRLDQALARGDRNAVSVALLFVDLDRFKPVNDSLGHAIGDQLLQAVAKRLLTCVRNSDTVGRFGGDEFMVLLTDVSCAEDTTLCAEKVLRAIQTPFNVGGHVLTVSASIGIAIFPQDATDPKLLLKYADIAMYQAKYAGRNSHQHFTPAMISGQDIGIADIESSAEPS